MSHELNALVGAVLVGAALVGAALVGAAPLAPEGASAFPEAEAFEAPRFERGSIGIKAVATLRNDSTLKKLKSHSDGRYLKDGLGDRSNVALRR